jgi:hypothetical protein
MRTHLPAALLATTLAGSLFAAPAQATAARTFVSAAGSDSNNCTNVATPCRHLAAAYAATAANGEIYVLDPANYGSLTITGPVSIEGHGWASIAPVANSAAITINANSGDAINIIGVVLDGTALTNTIGIRFNSGGSLIVRDSVIRNFSGSGIALTPNSSADFAVSNTLVANNGGHGIYVQPSGLNVSVTAMFNRVEADYNGVMGIGIFNNVTTGVQSATFAKAVDCVTSHNLDTGYYVLGGNNVTTIFEVFRSASLRDLTGVRAETNGVAIVSQSDLDEFPEFSPPNIAWSNSSGTGSVFSYGDNNTDNIAPPTGTVSKK